MKQTTSLWALASISLAIAACGSDPRQVVLPEPAAAPAIESSSDERLPAPPENSLETHDLEAELLWQEVRSSNDVDRIRDWYQHHFESPHAPETRRLWENLRLAQLRDAASVELCELYLEEFPAGKARDEIEQLKGRLEWYRARASSDPEQITRWIESNPTSPHLPAAHTRLVELRAVRERAQWERIAEQRDIAAIEAWLAEHSGSLLREEALELRQDLRYQEVQDSASGELCERYLAELATSRYLTQVRQICREARAWEEAAKEDTVDSYLRFQKRFPNGGHVTAAHRRASVAYWLERSEQTPAKDHVWVELARACTVNRACTMDRIDGAYRTAFRLNTSNPRALVGLAVMHDARGESVKALELLERAVALDDDRAEAHFYRGKILVKTAGCERAMPHLDRAVELSPEYVEALYHRGRCRLQLSSCRAALKDFSAVLTLAAESDRKFVLQAERSIASCRSSLP